jgi:hypothetical protein
MLEATYDGGLGSTQRITSMVIAGIFLCGCEQADPLRHVETERRMMMPVSNQVAAESPEIPGATHMDEVEVDR